MISNRGLQSVSRRALQFNIRYQVQKERNRHIRNTAWHSSNSQMTQKTVYITGGARGGESRFMAALREITEETGFLPYAAEITFKHKRKIRPAMSGRNKFQEYHTMCLFKASGIPKPGGGDDKRIG